MREEWGYGTGLSVYPTLLQSDTLQSFGHTTEDTRHVGVDLRKKPKDLSVSERGVWVWEGCEYGGCT